jgi:hypothetical protein
MLNCAVPLKLQGRNTSVVVVVVTGKVVVVVVYALNITIIPLSLQASNKVVVVVVVGGIVVVVVVVGGTKQSKTAVKSKTSQGEVVVVVTVGQDPDEKNDESKSGQLEEDGLGPNCKQGPSKTVDKHHKLPPVKE